MFILFLRMILPLLRSRRPLLRLWSLALLLWRGSLTLLHLGSLALLWRSSLTLLHLGSLALLRRSRLTLLRLGSLALLLRRSRLTLLHLGSLALLLRRSRLTLLHLGRLLMRYILTLLFLLLNGRALLLRSRLPLLLFRNRLALLRLRLRLPLLLRLRSRLSLLLLRDSLPLLLWRGSLPLLLLRNLLRAHRLRCWRRHIAVCGKRPVDGHCGRASVIDVGKLSPVRARGAFVLHLRCHRRRMRFAQCLQFRRPGSHLNATGATVEAYPGFASAPPANRVLVDVMHDVVVDIVDRAVVIEVAAAPVTALVSKAHVAETVVDAAIIAYVPTPVAAIKAVPVMPEAPVTRCPESPLVGSLDPRAGYPVIAHRSEGPITRCPDIVVPRILRLVVIGQRGRRLGCVLGRLLSVSRIV